MLVKKLKRYDTGLNRKRRDIDVYCSLPYLQTVDEILSSRFWKKTGTVNFKIRDPIKRSKKKASRRINDHLEGISGATRRSAMSFPKLNQLHSFEKRLVELTVGADTYYQHLEDLCKLYAKIHTIARTHEQEIFKAPTTSDVDIISQKCQDHMREYISQNKTQIDAAVTMAQTLRGLPGIELDKPMLALVGAPNVGKSSLVHALSTGNPEIANYPFTTRGISIGHIYCDDQTFQIADTPGLLNRSSRNRIEAFTTATLEHTNAAIAFVTDLSGHSGTSVNDQIEIRKSVRKTVSDRRVDWIDIISKTDVTSKDMLTSFKLDGDGPVFYVSVASKEGLKEIDQKVRTMVTDLSHC